MKYRVLSALKMVWVGAMLAVGSVGCTSQHESGVIATPEPVSGWDGVKAVTRAGQVTFASQPTEASLQRFDAEGGTMVIDLRTHEGSDTPGFDERARVEALGMKYVNIPITPAGFSKADVDKFAQLKKESKGPILVHCASSNRVGGLWAAYLNLKEGVPVEQAIAAGKAAGLRSAEAEAASRRVMGE